MFGHFTTSMKGLILLERFPNLLKLFEHVISLRHCESTKTDCRMPTEIPICFYLRWAYLYRSVLLVRSLCLSAEMNVLGSPKTSYICTKSTKMPTFFLEVFNVFHICVSRLTIETLLFRLYTFKWEKWASFDIEITKTNVLATMALLSIYLKTKELLT